LHPVDQRPTTQEVDAVLKNDSFGFLNRAGNSWKVDETEFFFDIDELDFLDNIRGKSGPCFNESLPAIMTMTDVLHGGS
jgi:hypothetical protein